MAHSIAAFNWETGLNLQGNRMFSFKLKINNDSPNTVLKIQPEVFFIFSKTTSVPDTIFPAFADIPSKHKVLFI